MFGLIFFMFVQIITESFPISSSGHWALFQKMFHIKLPVDIIEAFDFFAHLPTVLIIIIFFRNEWGALLWRALFHWRYKDSYKRLWKILFKIMGLTIISALLITGTFHVLLKPFLRNYTYIYKEYFLIIGFLITAVSLFSLYIKNQTESDEPYEKWNLKKTIILGLVQGCAYLLPGVSRLATTYVAARWLKMSPRRSFEISFLLSFFLFAIAGLKGTYQVVTSSYAHVLLTADMWFVTVCATIFGYAGLYVVWRCAIAKKFWLFGVYEILPLIVSLLFLFF